MSGECDKCSEHAVDCECDYREIEPIVPLPVPLNFDPDAKIFNIVDEETDEILETYSYNDWLQRIKDFSGVNEDLMGPSNEDSSTVAMNPFLQRRKYEKT
jgi:hypothetical protein